MIIDRIVNEIVNEIGIARKAAGAIRDISDLRLLINACTASHGSIATRSGWSVPST